ncbi:MAG: hypothetical protein M3040_05530 [Bacteroidota bacterium]|nr:hypothetical protein [Bacteroidota bacterium]
MLITLFACIIFLFLTVSAGSKASFALDRFFKATNFSLFQNFLLGTALLACYFNIWSLFLPTNFYSLLPVFILCSIMAFYFKGILERARHYFSRIFTSSVALVTIPILLVIFIYSLLPPQHGDSPGYHFLAIRWIEAYKAVPGLANLHGRLGFNSSFFVSSAAFTFSRLANQPLYVLNVAFTGCYYLWLLGKIAGYKNSLWSVVFLAIAVLMFRQLLDSISSPTPDVLATIIISYVFITVAESFLIRGRLDECKTIIILLLICFGFTVKLNTFPLGFIGLFLFINGELYKSRKAVVLLATVAFIILAPWMIRNYILTGYLIFPVAATGLLHPDWQVPDQILHFEKLLINNGPKLISQNWEAVDSLSFPQWFPQWIKAHSAHGLTGSLVILAAAIVCAAASLFLIDRKKYSSIYLLAIINIVAIAFWIYNSPDYRFGYPYLINEVLLLALFLSKNTALPFSIKLLPAVLAFIVCSYYFKHAAVILFRFPLSSYLVKPLPGIQYSAQTNLSRFPSIMLNRQVKLYVEDKNHWCNLADVPCYIPFTDSLPASYLQLRGRGIEEGFRIARK